MNIMLHKEVAKDVWIGNQVHEMHPMHEDDQLLVEVGQHVEPSIPILLTKAGHYIYNSYAGFLWADRNDWAIIGPDIILSGPGMVKGELEYA